MSPSKKGLRPSLTKGCGPRAHSLCSHGSRLACSRRGSKSLHLRKDPSRASPLLGLFSALRVLARCSRRLGRFSLWWPRGMFSDAHVVGKHDHTSSPPAGGELYEVFRQTEGRPHGAAPTIASKYLRIRVWDPPRFSARGGGGRRALVDHIKARRKFSCKTPVQD